MFQRSIATRVLQLCAALSLGAAACGGEEDCIIPPCALPLAVQLTLRDSATTTPVSGATIAFTGPYAGSGPCTGATCYVNGSMGTYDIDVSAPGYRSAHVQVVVKGTPAADCGCGLVETQQVSVTLARGT